ncbi:2-amino-4-hydroxy-6-hydroxymethyldihydropteridine diphosphokinase [Mangrovimicrobium sediminis]|uniref:2-amino-4-hydroxy-6-hydroxymethyldihydropteridine diphosphokinase n=1 Tax=Mangrovimicrobium sediminis TaxID=2562682 RepID=A0A4Z0LYS2_9GAMM|nr:2-amino-4-hydroxy-6-hydroxymethyldihydropteridine diphosphokinase [Haliea sp. SAOS-164]TGD72492.1 2-amino-4-hydroxy-6-hydroxymethyldihydropteridine diphosphokinase [Haliea sp. SAOS-164]
MAQVFLGLGSNVERERYIAAGLDALAELFGELAISPVYDCPAVGFDGQPFYNLVVGVETTLSVGELARRLRAIEMAHGRAADAPRFAPRQLDIDILTYDDLTGVIDGVELPRGELLNRAFVLRPMADLVPDLCHPLDGRSYASLWRAFGDDGGLRPAVYSWRGRPL